MLHYLPKAIDQFIEFFTNGELQLFSASVPPVPSSLSDFCSFDNSGSSSFYCQQTLDLQI